MKQKKDDMELLKRDLILIILFTFGVIAIIQAYTVSSPSKPYCVQNVTEYWYQNSTGQGFIVTEPETDCRLVGDTEEDGVIHRGYWCESAERGFVLTEPETEFKKIRTVNGVEVCK